MQLFLFLVGILLMDTANITCFIALCLLIIHVGANQDQKPVANTTKLLEDLRDDFNKRVLEPSTIIKDDELFCECNRPGCDKEITDIVGSNFAGICRAHFGGVCHKVILFNDVGDVKNIALSCISSTDLVPPGRPFICETMLDSNQLVFCCSNASFCNHYEPLEIVPRKSIIHLHCYFFILLIVATVFSTAGLLAGIYLCGNSKAKEFLHQITGVQPLGRTFRRTLAANSMDEFEDEGARLKGLLDDLDSTIRSSSGSGAGVPSLAERTISRQITLHNIIGQGRYGEVFLGEWRGDKVAVKIFISREEASWQRETEIYRTNMLRHSNVLRWIASDNKDTGTNTQLWLVTEYCSFGSLYEYLGNYEINQVLAVQFVRSCVLGLAYLHTEVSGVDSQTSSTKPAIAHRDIKSRNILVKSDLTCVIADLGLAVRNVRGRVDLPSGSRGGTIRYLAPEFLDDSFADDSFDAYTRMDIYALGLTIWEICRRVAANNAPPDSPPGPGELMPAVDASTAALVSSTSTRLTGNVSCPGIIESHSRELPYYEYVDREPTLEEMRECVCVNKCRPTIPQAWQTSSIMREMVRIMCECWSPDANARLLSLNIRFSLDKLIRNHGLKVSPD